MRTGPAPRVARALRPRRPVTLRQFIQRLAISSILNKIQDIGNWRIDPIRSPFAPAADTSPPELACRDELRATLRIALERAGIGRPAKSAMLVGLRGVRKTVLLDRVSEDAEGAGIHTVRIEAPEGRSLPSLLAPQLRQALLRLSQIEKAKAFAVRALRALAGR